ncbi:bcl-2-related protein A1-like [Engraulis encrasicolus]|uniref:bcl-2-related protein A1-like n=1 Tax=Engraulis encrasicolus TaxID=184585 RepID=UPI002FCFA6EE
MASEGISEDNMTENILHRVVANNLKGRGVDVVSLLPKTKPAQGKEAIVITQVAEMLKETGDWVQERHVQRIADTVDGVVNYIQENPGNVGNFYHNLMAQMFDDGIINWGRIVMLFYTLGKLAVRLVTTGLGDVREMLTQAVGYLRKNVVGWIIRMGGWMCSIAAIAKFRITTVPLVTPPKPTSEGAIALTYLTSGMVLGGILVFWMMSKTKQ